MLQKIVGFIAVLGVLSACSSPPNTPYYQPSTIQHFDFAGNQEARFEDYIAHTRAQMKLHRVALVAENAEQEIEQTAPYVLAPPANCSKPEKGVLLVHGLLDSAYALRDIGQRLAQKCVLVYGLLLPGHGSRAADLVNIHRDDWLAAVRFGVNALAKQVSDVTLIGFSLGGALSTHIAGENMRVNRLVLLAPALQLAYPILSSQTLWLRYVRDWLDLDPPYMAVRYQSMPTQAVAQTYLLSRTVRQNLQQRALTQPTFMILVADDLVIDADTSLRLFSQFMPNPKGQAWVYGGLQNQSTTSQNDARVRQIEVADKQKKIVNYSHVTLPFSPQNPLFGENGVHKECGLHIGIVAKEDALACMATQDTWKGEIGSNSDSQKPFQRLTYHPQFEDMVNAISSFMGL
jgi:esterase/lipase